VVWRRSEAPAAFVAWDRLALIRVCDLSVSGVGFVVEQPVEQVAKDGERSADDREDQRGREATLASVSGRARGDRERDERDPQYAEQPGEHTLAPPGDDRQAQIRGRDRDLSCRNRASHFSVPSR
jgi:hypothetical protein